MRHPGRWGLGVACNRVENGEGADPQFRQAG